MEMDALNAQLRAARKDVQHQKQAKKWGNVSSTYFTIAVLYCKKQLVRTGMGHHLNRGDEERGLKASAAGSKYTIRDVRAYG